VIPEEHLQHHDADVLQGHESGESLRDRAHGGRRVRPRRSCECCRDGP
jgi:hypothetical protein